MSYSTVVHECVFYGIYNCAFDVHHCWYTCIHVITITSQNTQLYGKKNLVMCADCRPVFNVKVIHVKGRSSLPVSTLLHVPTALHPCVANTATNCLSD